MIKYLLKCKSSYCSNKNSFDGWFQNIEEYENQKSRGLILCPVCGAEDIIKSLSTPSFRLNKKVKTLQTDNKKNDVADKNLGKPAIPIENDISILLRSIKKEIQKNSEFVGDSFIKEVRFMKSGKTKVRSIYGHGSKKDIEELKDEGIDILKVPWIPDDH